MPKGNLLIPNSSFHWKRFEKYFIKYKLGPLIQFGECQMPFMTQAIREAHLFKLIKYNHPRCKRTKHQRTIINWPNTIFGDKPFILEGVIIGGHLLFVHALKTISCNAKGQKTTVTCEIAYLDVIWLATAYSNHFN